MGRVGGASYPLKHSRVALPLGSVSSLAILGSVSPSISFQPAGSVSSPQAGSQVFLSDICVKLLVWVFLYIVPSYLYLHQYFCMKCNISVRSWANNLNDRLATGLFIERIIGSIIEALVLVPVVGRPLPGGWHLQVCRHPFYCSILLMRNECMIDWNHGKWEFWFMVIIIILILIIIVGAMSHVRWIIFKAKRCSFREFWVWQEGVG